MSHEPYLTQLPGYSENENLQLWREIESNLAEINYDLYTCKHGLLPE